METNFFYGSYSCKLKMEGKRFVLILFALVLIVALCSCTKSDSDDVFTSSISDVQNEGAGTEETSVTDSVCNSKPTTEPTEHGEEATENSELVEVTTETIAPTEHQHSYATITTAESCEKQGYTTYTCACGDSYKDNYTPAVGHSFEHFVKESTCTERGYTTYTCSSCGISYQDEYTNATGHSFGNWETVKEPTATATGTAERACGTCSATEKKVLDRVIPDHTHSYTEKVTKTATCTAEGVKTFTCSCGGSYTESIAKVAHSYKAVVTAPTCTNKGYTVHTCTACGDSYTDSYTEAKGHSYKSVVTAPTCTEGGYTTYTCSACGNSYEAVQTVAKGHSYTSKVTTEATCTKAGVKTYTCSACSDKYTESVPAVGHSYSSVVTAPTCTTEGYTTYTCNRCGDSYKGNYTDAKGHSYTSKVTKAATCTAEGIKTYTCNCGNSYTEAIAKTSHSYTQYITKAPRCDQTGIYTYACSCGDNYTETIPKSTEHSWKSWVTLNEPTETATGLAERTCVFCGSKETKILQAGNHVHSYTSKETKAATCHRTGIRIYTCSCGYYYSEVIPVNDNHAFGVWETIRKPTETTTGIAERICSWCGDKETKTLDKLTGPAHTEPTGCDHNYTRISISANCIWESKTVCTCKICGYSFEEVDGPKNPDNHYYTLTSSVKGNCATGLSGSETYTCMYCGDSYNKIIAGGHDWVHHRTEEVGHTNVFYSCPHDNEWFWESDWGSEDDLLASFNEHAMPDWWNHSWGNYGSEWVVDIPAVDSWTCSVCGTTTYSQP